MDRAGAGDCGRPRPVAARFIDGEDRLRDVVERARTPAGDEGMWDEKRLEAGDKEGMLLDVTLRDRGMLCLGGTAGGRGESITLERGE